MEPSTVKELLTGDEQFAPDLKSVWAAVEAGSARRRVTRRRFVVGGVVAGVAAITAGTTLVKRGPSQVALPGPAPTTSTTTNLPPGKSFSTSAHPPVATSSAAVAFPPPPATSLAHGRWAAIPAAPSAARSGAVGVWTGTEMLIWGGTSNNNPSADGIAYDPVRRRWRTLPPAPAAARANWSGVWAGDSLILWGVATTTGQDISPTGARYTPRTDRWQMLPDPPIGVSSASIAVWTGSVMVALTVPTGGNPQQIAAATYDPDGNSWTSLPPIALPSGHPVLFLQAVAVRSTVYVWSRWQHTQGGGGTDGFVLDGATWRPVTFSGDSGINGSAPIFTGTSLIQPADRVWQGVDAGPDPSDISGRLLDLDKRRVIDITQGPLDHQAPQAVWTGNALICLTFQGNAAAWNIATGRWIQLPHAPSAFDENPIAVWTGTSLLLWGRIENPKTSGNDPQIIPTGFQFSA